MRTVIIGTYPPRQCGIATFTYDLFNAINVPTNKTGIIAMTDGSERDFPEEVVRTIEVAVVEDYVKAAHFINLNYDVCIIQHEYGIFGGKAGRYILELLVLLEVPVVTNLHTILEKTDRYQYHVTKQLLANSTWVTVMTDRAVHMLVKHYGIDKRNISLIPHGTPAFAYDHTKAKADLGLRNKRVMLSFGFLGPSKGFETAIDAVAKINDPDLVYVILGQTHPNVLKTEGEAYRQSLVDRAEVLEIADRVRFVDVFATQELLVRYLTACDIYVSPYPNEYQISSGTLSFAVGAGAVVISTPYWYARDLLADGRGLFFDFRDADALTRIINILLENPLLIAHFREKARTYGQQLTWLNIGRRQLTLLKRLYSGKSISPKTIPLGVGLSKKGITPIFPVDNKRLSS